jgi:hypothetical protein
MTQLALLLQLLFITLVMEAVRTSETSAYSKTTRRYIPKGYNLHTRRRGNLNFTYYN